MLINRFERIMKFVMIISQTWKSKNAPNYDTAQKRLSNSLIFGLTMLYREYIEEDRDTERFAILCTSLRNIFLYLILIIEHSYKKLSQNETQQPLHLSACQRVFIDIISDKSQMEPLGISLNAQMFKVISIPNP